MDVGQTDKGLNTFVSSLCILPQFFGGEIIDLFIFLMEYFPKKSAKINIQIKSKMAKITFRQWKMCAVCQALQFECGFFFFFWLLGFFCEGGVRPVLGLWWCLPLTSESGCCKLLVTSYCHTSSQKHKLQTKK